MSLQPGATLDNGKYRVLRLLGRGGFGAVYLAEDLLLHEQVAIKELVPALLDDPVILQRFINEAKVSRRLRHLNIAATYALFAEGENQYIVMEYVPGGSLEQRLEPGPLAVDEAVRIAAEVADGLSHAHERGIVHCDLKPANILFTADGHAKIVDFGIAHIQAATQARTWATATGLVFGTLSYMAPEQADGVRDDPRVDVYALGVVLYRMLAGRPYLPFEDSTTPAALSRNLRRVLEEAPVPPSRHNKRVPAWLDAVAMAALAKRPEDRLPSAAATREALLTRTAPPAAREDAPAAATELGSAVEATQPVIRRSAPPTPPPARPQPQRARFPLWLPLVLLVVLAAGGLGIWLARGGAATQPPAGPAAASAPATRPPAAVATPAASASPAPSAQVPSPARAAAVTPILDEAHPGMVVVPAGEFQMGCTPGGIFPCLDDDQPLHTVYLDAFAIDATEVTNGQYRLCVDTGPCTPPSSTSSKARFPYYETTRYPKFRDYPVIFVDWNQAGAYCRWVGKRLPTEAEWEKAARGSGDTRTYPWGEEPPDCERAYAYNDSAAKPCVYDTGHAGEHPAGASPYGALDMAGNVWEWVADRWDPDYYAVSPRNNPTGSPYGDSRVLRGGAFFTRGRSLAVFDRNRQSPGSFEIT